jgi:hypothetical protein
LLAPSYKYDTRTHTHTHTYIHSVGVCTVLICLMVWTSGGFL